MDSIKRMRVTFRNHISCWLLEKELSEITTFDVDKALSECKLSRSRKYAYYVLHNSLKKAYRVGLLTQNVADNMERVKHREKRGSALTFKEQSAFLNSIKGNPYEYVFRFMLVTGVRRSEAVCLRWSDIDFENGIIHIRGTKTEASDRVFFLTSDILEILLKQRARVKGERIFPYSGDNLTHVFKSFCPNHKLHDLRHTFVTRCAESGVNISVTQQLAGHSNINTTLNIYTHVLTDFAREEFKKFKLDK